ncbi:hypothetical protein B0H14DRAFT_3173012 [Mycena olivaceomarginata]|nr:hypothetical protein B0H14DRAFT_3173012 [Mycena olivaceomarginata]
MMWPFRWNPPADISCAGKQSGGEVLRGRVPGPSYARLARFTKAVVTNGGHTRTVFGPNASFFSISSSGFCWQNLPPGLEDNIQSCNKLRRPRRHNVSPPPDNNLEKAPKKRGLMYCALNPFVGGEYYVVYGDGGSTWCLHPTWSADVKTVSLRIKELLGDPPTTPTAPPSSYVRTSTIRAPSHPSIRRASRHPHIYAPPPPMAAPANGSGHKMNWQRAWCVGSQSYVYHNGNADLATVWELIVALCGGLG